LIKVAEDVFRDCIFELIWMHCWWFCSFGQNEIKRSEIKVMTRSDMLRKDQASMMTHWILSHFGFFCGFYLHLGHLQVFFVAALHGIWFSSCQSVCASVSLC